MENPSRSPLTTGNPTVESFNVKPCPDLSYPDFKTRCHHPYNPWGPTTKFYVRFTIRPIHHFHFQGPRRSAPHALPTTHVGLVLARAYEGRGNLCIWEGQILDALPAAAGIGLNLAKAISRNVHDRIVDTPKWKEIVEIKVEMDVITPYYVAGDEGLDRVSEPVVSRVLVRPGGEGGDCGICFEPLVKEVVVRQTACSHFFHARCLGCAVGGASRRVFCPICRVEFGSGQVLFNN